MSALCMEPASDAQAAMAGVEASCDPPPPAALPPPPPPAAPPPPPPPPLASAASTKRRWSPSTWRYAIEDSQAELPSRPRPTLGIATAPPSSRPLHSSPPQQPFKSKPPYYNPLYGKAAEESHRSIYASRTQTMVEAHVRSSPSQLPAGAKTRASEVSRKSNHHLHNSGARAFENREDEEDEDEDDAEQEDHEDDQGTAMYDDEYFKKRRREMSPSELYFCEICSEKAVGSKGTLCAYRES